MGGPEGLRRAVEQAEGGMSRQDRETLRRLRKLQWTRLFHMADADSDGTIGLDDFLDVFGRASPDRIALCKAANLLHQSELTPYQVFGAIDRTQQSLQQMWTCL